MKSEEYSDKAFVVRGEYTKKYINELKSMNGRFNPKLKGGAGWIFSKRHKDKLNTFIDQKNKECGQMFFDQKESDSEESISEESEIEESEIDNKIEVNSRFETERKHLEIERIAVETERKHLERERIAVETERKYLERRNDILETTYDIEFDTMENKRMDEFNKVNKVILKGGRILKLALIFFCVVYISNNIRDDIYEYLNTSINTKYISISHM